MKLPASRWQQAWHDEDLAGKFVKDLDKLEKGTVQTLDSSAKWLEQLLVELGQYVSDGGTLEGCLKRQHNLTDQDVQALKSGERRVLLILDAYDESGLRENLYERDHLHLWARTKVVFTVRDDQQRVDDEDMFVPKRGRKFSVSTSMKRNAR